ncbi:ABC transporter ATP-binding protein [Pseudoflavonifractor capillosus]
MPLLKESTYMLEIRDLRYEVDDGDRTLGILQGISLTIPEHKFIVVTGPNGGGKTTLAKAIMGIVEPTGGQILWNGQDVTHMSITDRARLGISYGFQQPPRFKGLRVRDLLSMAAGNDKLTRDEACQYLTRVGLCAKDYIDREVDTSLSGGEVKRIEIATILARKSGLMIFDEPEAGIDLWSFARLTETFRDIHDRRDATLIVISHQERIIDLADEIIMVSGGKIVKQGPKDQIFPEILANTISGCSYLTEGVKA